MFNRTMIPTLVGAVVFMAAAANAIDLYPEGHFDRVSKFTDISMMNDFVEKQTQQDKTVFVRMIASSG